MGSIVRLTDEHHIFTGLLIIFIVKKGVIWYNHQKLKTCLEKSFIL